MNKLKQIPLMKQKFWYNLSQIGALYDFYGQKNLGRQSSGIELKLSSPALKVELRTLQQRVLTK